MKCLHCGGSGRVARPVSVVDRRTSKYINLPYRLMEYPCPVCHGLGEKPVARRHPLAMLDFHDWRWLSSWLISASLALSFVPIIALLNRAGLMPDLPEGVSFWRAWLLCAVGWQASRFAYTLLSEGGKRIVGPHDFNYGPWFLNTANVLTTASYAATLVVLTLVSKTRFGSVGFFASAAAISAAAEAALTIFALWVHRRQEDASTGALQRRTQRKAWAKALVKSSQYREFDQKFRESLKLKDGGSLGSALRLRREATRVARDVPALYCIGKHNEMILEFHHIGLGTAARESALGSLTHEDDFRDISVVLCREYKANCYQESLHFLTALCTSYEEALYFFAKAKDQFPTHGNRQNYESLRDFQASNSRWYDAQRAIAGNFYSRASPEMDRGRFASGLAVLDVILANAKNVGYDLDYDEYVDLLDDICALSIRLLLEKGKLRPKHWSPHEEADELGCVLRRSIMYLREFYPDCRPQHRDLFRRHYKVFSSVPWICEVPGWNDVPVY